MICASTGHVFSARLCHVSLERPTRAMRLLHLSVENFRGVRSLDLDLDEMTVVIAENKHGKTSVFDVLGLCLGPRGADPDTLFREEDFYRDVNGTIADIRIVLTFEGEETLRLEFLGAHTDRKLVRSFIDTEGQALDPQPDAGVFQALQERHPVLLLRFSQPTLARLDDGEADDSTGPDKRRSRLRLAETVARVYRDLAHTREPLPADEIASALRAAQDLLTESPEDGHPPLHGMLEELRQEVQAWNRPRRADSMIDLSGSGTHNLALLLVLGSLLDVRGGKALPSDACPIIAIEEPEAHLHPILLASTWEVIESLKAQTIVTTNSGELLSSVPMISLRRLVKVDDHVLVHRLRRETLRESDLRRVSYHVRARRGGVLFARCWLMVEGESEFWLMNHLSQIMGYDLESEGIRTIEFAQCGVGPLLKLANDLGIAWHLLADGDESGQVYARDARRLLGDALEGRRISELGHRDIEHYLWHSGFEPVYRNAARIAPRPDGGGPPPGHIIGKAVRRTSKPYLALAVAEACEREGPAAIPPVLRSVVETAVMLARQAAGDARPS